MIKLYTYIFDTIENLYNAILKKKTYIVYHSYHPFVSNNDDKYDCYECAFDFEAMLKAITTKDESK
jgi:hypothetical protein